MVVLVVNCLVVGDYKADLPSRPPGVDALRVEGRMGQTLAWPSRLFQAVD